MMALVLCVFVAASLVGLPDVSAANYNPIVLSWNIIGRDGLCLDVMGGFNDNHIPTQRWRCGQYQNNQLWTIHGDGTIRSMDKCLVSHQPYPGSYTMINDCKNSHPDDKTWKLYPDGTLVHVHSGLVLTGGSTSPYPITTIENNTYAATQCWQIRTSWAPIVTPIKGFRNLCLQAQNDKEPVWMNSCMKNYTQEWTIFSDCTIRASFNTSLCLSGTGTSSHDAIVIAKCEGTPLQRWFWQDDGTILNPSTNLVMDVKQSNPNLHQVILYPPTGNPNQQWIFPVLSQTLSGKSPI